MKSALTKLFARGHSVQYSLEKNNVKITVTDSNKLEEWCLLPLTIGDIGLYNATTYLSDRLLRVVKTPLPNIKKYM